MVEIWETIKSLLLYISPLAVIAFGLLTAWGIIKWFDKLNDAIKGIAEHPGRIIFAILLISAGLYFLISYIWPLFE